MESLRKIRKSNCTQCNKSVSAHYFASHLQTHLPQVERSMFKCSVELCPKIYYTKNSLSQHLKNYRTPNLNRCDLCCKNYSSKAELKLYGMRIHSAKYGCTLCNAIFKSKLGRNFHVVAKHTGEKAFPCEKCPAKFSSAIHLKNHKFVHSHERRHKCSTCSRQFKRKESLTIHVKNIHSQRTKDFYCSTCQKTFYRKSQLNEHAKTHAIGGDFAFYFCKKEFTLRMCLESHLRTHTQEMPYFCPDKSCKYSCAHLNNLRRHQRHHYSSPEDQATPSKILHCYFCSKIYRAHHTLEEPFPCKLCKKAFKEGSHLRQHIFSHTKEKPFGCPHCGKCFSHNGGLKRHVPIHTGEKKFFCEFCSYSPFQKSHFVDHLSRRH